MSNVFSLRKEEQPIEKVFDPQKGTDSFIAWIFVKNHATYNLYRSIYQGLVNLWTNQAISRRCRPGWDARHKPRW